jgi:hypothetical protein
MSVKPTTFANYSTYARAYVVPVIGSRNLQDLEPATITAFYLHLLTHGRRRRATNHAMRFPRVARSVGYLAAAGSGLVPRQATFGR